MLRATDVIAAGAADPARIVDSVILDRARRRRPDGACLGVGGTAFLLALPSPVSLRMGDALVLEDGRLVEVVAEAEPLLEVRADPDRLARLAWALGDHHRPVEIRPNRLRVQPGPQVEALIAGLGLRAVAIEAPFDPEGGAYASAPQGHHDHGHGHHRHDHHHGHDHGHHHDHHDHGGCGCGHAGPAASARNAR